MKTLLVLANSLALSALVLTTQAQAPATSHDNPAPAKTTAQPHQTYGGVKVNKKMARRMVQKSRPADAIIMRIDEVLPQKASKK